MAKDRLNLIIFLIIMLNFIFINLNSSLNYETENLLIKRPKRQNISKLKQEISDSLITLLQESSKIIELHSQIQQKVQRNILEYISNEKNNYLVKNNDRIILDQISNRLKLSKDSWRKEKEDLIKLNNYLEFKDNKSKIIKC